MADIGSVVGTILMRDRFSAVFGKFDKDLDKASKKVLATGREMTAAGIALTKVVTLPIVAIGGLSTKAFSTFDQAMTQSLAIMGDVSDSMRENMADAARELPLIIRASAAESAAGFEFLARAGKTAEQALVLLPITARFANAGLIDLALGTDLLTDAQSALGLSTKDVQQDQINMVRVSDVLVKANTLANASIIQFSRSLTTKAGDSMRRFSQDIEEGVSILAAWADQGVKGELAGERYSIVLRDMTNKSIANREAFLKHNIAVFDQTGKVRSLVDIIEDMEVAFEGMSDEMRRATLMSLGFTFKSVDATSSLIGLSGRIRQYEKDLRAAGGATQEVSDNQMKSFAAQLIVVKNRIVDVGIELGSKLAPIIESKIIPIVVSVTDFVRRMIDKFGELPGGLQTAIVAVTAFVAALGPLLIAAGAIVTAWGFVVGALGGVAGIAAAAGITTAFTAIGVVIFGPRGIVAGFRTAADTAKALWDRTKEGRTFVVNLARVIAGDLSNAVGKATDAISRIVTRFVDWLGVNIKIKSMLTIISETVLKITKVFGFFADKVSFVAKMVKLAMKELGGFRPVVVSLLAVLQLVNPAFASGALQIIDWTDRAQEMTEAAIDLAAEIERDTASVEDMSKTLVEVTKEVKVLSKEEENLIRLQNAVTRAVDSMTAANKKSAAQLKIDGIVRLREWGLEIEKLPGSFDTLVVSIQKLNEEAQKDSLSKLVSDEIHAIIVDIGRAEAERLEIYRQMNELDLSLELREQVFAALGIKHESLEILTTWEKMQDVVGIFSQIDGIVGDIATGVAGIVEGFKGLKGGRGSEGFGAALVGFAQGISDLGEAIGLFEFKGPQGTSKFGGSTEGDESQAGATFGAIAGGIIGSAFGPIGAQIGSQLGAIAGKILGSFINHGADTAEATMKQMGDELSLRVSKEEGPLGKPIRLIGKLVADSINVIEDIIGGQIALPDFSFKIREDIITVWMGPLNSAVKNKFDTIAEAIDFIVTESIKKAEFGEGVPERFVTALKNASIETVEELQELLVFVAEIEAIASDMGPIGLGMQAVATQVSQAERMIAEAGLQAADAVLIQAKLIGEIRDTLTKGIEGAIGVKDTAGMLAEFAQGISEFNEGIDKVIATREAELAAAIEANAAIGQMSDTLGTGAVGSVEAFEDSMIGFSIEGGRFSRGVGRMGDMTKGAAFDVEAFADAMGKLPERIDIRELQKAATVAASGVAVTLIDMIQSVRGTGVLAAEKQRQQEAAFKIQLAAQIAQLVALSQMTELFSTVAIAGFKGVINEALQLLDDLNTGASSIGDQATKAASGRGKARRAAEESFRESADRVIATLAGATEASFTFADSVRAIRDQAKEAKITFAETERAISNLAELEVGQIAETWSNAIDTIRRSNLGNAVAEIMVRAQASIDEINARADANQAAANNALLIVSEGVQAEMHKLGQESLLALSGPVAEVRAEINATVRDIKFMVRNVSEFGQTLVQVANRIRDGIVPQIVAIGIREAERLGLTEKAAEFRAIQGELELKVQAIQLLGLRTMLIAAGAFDEATKALFDDVFELFGAGRGLIEIPSIDTTQIEESTDTVEETWTGTADVIVESSTRMTDGFIVLSKEFDRVNRKFVQLSTNTVTLTNDIIELSPVTFRAAKRISELTSQLTALSNVGFPSVPSFSHGSEGFIEFGSGTLIQTDGREEIVTEARGNSIADMVRIAIQQGKGSDAGSPLLGAFVQGQEEERIDRQENTLALKDLLRFIEAEEVRKNVQDQDISKPL